MKAISILLVMPSFLQFSSFPIFLLQISFYNVYSLSGGLDRDYEPELPSPHPLQIPPPVPSQIEPELSVPPSSSLQRESKLFPYFLVQFPNDPCSNAGGTQHGICVSARDCRTAGGMMVGTCAHGFGACCRYIKSCGAEGGDIQIRENSTEIRSGNTSSYCRFILPKTRGICQVKLNFVKFEFGEATANGDCTQTRIEITGGTVGFPNLCGNLTGQHLYINYGSSEKIFIHSGESTLPTDTYSIRISYIRCESRSRQIVPNHCSQYYTGSSGQVRSLNWPHQQLNDLEYTICIEDPQNSVSRRRGRKFNQKSSQKIEWSTCGSSYLNGTRDFFISGKISDPPTLTESGEYDTTDYVQIFGGNKQCGNRFRNETVSHPPYLVRVKFDAKETTNSEHPLAQGQERNNAVEVGKPENGCESLDTTETKCLELSSNLCKCKKTLKRTNSKMESRVNDDEGNTGFCLSYKIIE